MIGLLSLAESAEGFAAVEDETIGSSGASAVDAVEVSAEEGSLEGALEWHPDKDSRSSNSGSRTRSTTQL